MGDSFRRSVLSSYKRLSNGGYSRLIAWLALSGYDPFDSPAIAENWHRIIEATHTLRLQHKPSRKASLEDTQFTVVLSAFALFGQAITGTQTFAAAGLPTSAAHQKRFRAWLGKMLAAHLEQS